MRRVSEPRFGMVTETDLPVPMRDGTTLRADVYRPDSEGRFPVLLLRLPYGKQFISDFGDHEFFVPRGYVVVIQDGRGRFSSDGTFYSLVDEPFDGYDTVEWAAALPWSNGRVATIGQSYLGATQYLMAPTRPPHLVCQVPVSASADFHASWVYHTGGAFVLGWQIPYSIFLARNSIDRAGRWDELWPEIKPSLERPVNFANPLTPEAYRHLPLADWGELLADVAPYLADYLAHPDDGPYWWAINGERRHGDVNVPMLHVSSWYDIFSRDAIVNFNGMRSRAMTPEARGGQRLLLGPWGHLFPYTRPTSEGAGEADFGPDAMLDLHDVELRFLDHHLKGYDTGVAEEAPIRLFTMGVNRWRDEQEWPLARTRWESWYLRAGGELSRRPPSTDEAPDGFVYDPEDPVPTRGGNLLVLPIGVFDQREIEARDDVLAYTSEPLAEPVEVTGPIEVVLHAATSAVDTDFTAKLVDVRPDGYAANLVDGIIRARYRESARYPTLLDPGRPYELRIDLWATSHVFAAGHRIRVEISSSNFPRFDRNLNTGGDQATGTTWEVAEQTVFHDAARPSHIVLPVIP